MSKPEEDLAMTIRLKPSDRAQQRVEFRCVTRRTFLSGIAALGAAEFANRSAVALSIGEPSTLLHIPSYFDRYAILDSYRLHGADARRVGATRIEDFAAHCAHPTLPILYVARNPPLWERLPRGVLSTYAVERGPVPLRLLAETPMALSSTGPKAVSVSACGTVVMLSSSTGRAWNMLTLNAQGLPQGVAITRKETGALSAPHGVTFSPCKLLAAGADPGRGRLTLLKPGLEGIESLGTYLSPDGLADLSPAWTADGRYIFAANAERNTLFVLEVSTPEATQPFGAMTPVERTGTRTQITSILSDSDGVLTVRSSQTGSVIERWTITQGKLYREQRATTRMRITDAFSRSGKLWLVTEDHILKPSEDASVAFKRNAFDS